jgi:hypothetical protein
MKLAKYDYFEFGLCGLTLDFFQSENVAIDLGKLQALLSAYGKLQRMIHHFVKLNVNL